MSRSVASLVLLAMLLVDVSAVLVAMCFQALLAIVISRVILEVAALIALLDTH